jgi:hypothetical protein
MDYTYNNVNPYSLPLAPDSLQFGNTLNRILQRISYKDPTHGPVHLLKLDLADGYYRVKLSPEAALELAVVLPGATPKAKNLVGIPLVLPMGWKYSPNYFCAHTDITNQYITTLTMLPNHPLELPSQAMEVPAEAMSPSCIHPTTVTAQPPLAYADVYMDDFLGLAQRDTTELVLSALLNGVSDIFRHDSHPDDPPVRTAVISASKLLKGNLKWAMQKVVLGWMLDTANGTLSLPPHKLSRFHDLINHFLLLQRTSQCKWFQLLGELRAMAAAIQGGKYLFSILQHVLVDQPQAKRLRLNQLTKHALCDWLALATTITEHPVPIASLVPQAPAYIALVDASAQGIGGVWIPTQWTTTPHPPSSHNTTPPARSPTVI